MIAQDSSVCFSVRMYTCTMKFINKPGAGYKYMSLYVTVTYICIYVIQYSVFHSKYWISHVSCWRSKMVCRRRYTNCSNWKQCWKCERLEHQSQYIHMYLTQTVLVNPRHSWQQRVVVVTTDQKWRLDSLSFLRCLSCLRSRMSVMCLWLTVRVVVLCSSCWWTADWFQSGLINVILYDFDKALATDWSSARDVSWCGVDVSILWLSASIGVSS